MCHSKLVLPVPRKKDKNKLSMFSTFINHVQILKLSLKNMFILLNILRDENSAIKKLLNINSNAR